MDVIPWAAMISHARSPPFPDPLSLITLGLAPDARTRVLVEGAAVVEVVELVVVVVDVLERVADAMAMKPPHSPRLFRHFRNRENPRSLLDTMDFPIGRFGCWSR